MTGNMNKVNYQKEFEKVLCDITSASQRPTLLLHSCCAPCSSYCLVYLRQWFDITCFYYNPNITDEAEYRLRADELSRLVERLNNDPIMLTCDEGNNVRLCEGVVADLSRLGKLEVIQGDYHPERFFEAVKKNHYENEPEGGQRCRLCFDMRLTEAVKIAEDKGIDYVTTSLTISPLKNAAVINEIGQGIISGKDMHVQWLPSDFKKKNGYKMSVELCERYGMYRQDYCGCVYSQIQR